MSRIPDIYKYDKIPCPDCGGTDISMAVDTVIGYWYAFCEGCGFKGKEKKLEKLPSSTEETTPILGEVRK